MAQIINKKYIMKTDITIIHSPDSVKAVKLSFVNSSVDIPREAMDKMIKAVIDFIADNCVAS